MSDSEMIIDASAFFGVKLLQRIKERLAITITEHCFLPRPDDRQADWVASVAAPAFAIIAQRRAAEARRSFCSIGTGSGLDALAAVEILGARRVGVTDVHEDVVDAARRNIESNVTAEIELLAGTGDLLDPLLRYRPRFDVIYENLPNVPLTEGGRLKVERTSSGFVPSRHEAVPRTVEDNLLSLHYVALLQAKQFLSPGGTVLSTLGARVPLSAFVDLAEQAGYRPSFLTYGWKVQAQAIEIIEGFAAWQRQGLGPFHFYPVAELERVFAGLDPVAAAERAFAIEEQLAPRSIDAAAAYEACRSGARIGHTFAVLQSDPR